LTLKITLIIIKLKGSDFLKLSNRIQNMIFSPIRKLNPYAIQAKKEGVHVYHINIGQPDIETPMLFFDAVKDFKQKVLSYCDSQGIDPLIKSNIEYYKSIGIDFSEDELLITNGGSEALLFAFSACLDHGDSILTSNPFYTNYRNIADIVGNKIITFPTKPEDGFRLPSFEILESCVKEDTKALMLSSPGNPTGVVYTKEEIDTLCELCIKHDLFYITDEVYREFIYETDEHSSPLYREDMKDRTVLIDSVSKRYSACGARVGVIASKNKDIINNSLKMSQARLSSPTLEQIGAAALIKTPKEYFDKVREEYKKRRDVLYSGLSSIPGVMCQKPAGAFYAIAKLPVKNAENFCKWLLSDFRLDNKTIMMAPANGFYSDPLTEGLNEVRISYCINCDALKDSMIILKAALENYKD